MIDSGEAVVPLDDWAGPDGELRRYIVEESRRTLDSYRAQPNLIAEHANVEQDTAHGGYQHRQLFELVSNSADALWSVAGDGVTCGSTVEGNHGRIEVRLIQDFLYCADNGRTIDSAGVRALMFSHLSPRRGTSQIGTFGLGFKAVLGVSDSPEFFSHSGSFRFDREHSRERIRGVVPNADRYPVLRLPEPIDPAERREQDPVLRELMVWAVNIVRLPLKSGVRDDIRQQMISFPTEFLLFVPHVGRLTITDGSEELNRVVELEKVDGEYLLADGEVTSQWKLFERYHRLSGDASADQRPGDNRNEVPIWWAAPVDRLDRSGRFWAFLPTSTASLVPGILNAPWKTNEDRQNLLTGRYNDELIESAAEMIADALAQLATADDPARHLDALPRRHESGDNNHANRLRQQLFAILHERAILPDQGGELWFKEEMFYPPLTLTKAGQASAAAFGRWASYLERPVDWLHHSALTRNRLATVDRLFDPEGEPSRWSGAPRASLAEWLEAVTGAAEPDSAVRASMAAIQTAALIPWDRRSDADLGRIVLTASDGWRPPDPDQVFLPDDPPNGGTTIDEASCVHPVLTSDNDTLSALRVLGLRPPSAESRFKGVAQIVLAVSSQDPSSAELHESFWKLSRGLAVADALAIIEEHSGWRRALRVRTRAGNWQPIHSTLMPGDIVSCDGSLDHEATVDSAFHGRDVALLHELGASDGPSGGRDLRWDPLFRQYQNSCESRYRQRADLPAQPWEGYLAFTSSEGVGPLMVLTVLSDEGRARFTDALLNQDASYEPCEMWHTGTNKNSYPRAPFEPPVVHVIRTHGRVRIADGIVPFADALGPQPESPAALHALLRHPNAEKIKRAFDLSEPIPEFAGEGEPVALTDVWPGLAEHLPAHRRSSRLVLCERIQIAGAERDCVFRAPDVYLVGNVDDDERSALELIAEALDLRLTRREIDEVLKRQTPAEVEERRAAVRRFPTDAERLLAAVGEQVLRTGLPLSLLDVLGDDREPLAGIDIAEAAIATYHTDALRQFRWALDALGPPGSWSGSRRAVDFVRSLGFSEEWAGEPNRRRPPFMEVVGPRSLPPLHDYQRTIATNVREMLRSEQGDGTERRGMLSMPTGSGKTRVAVEAIVEAMRDERFRGGVLWVADRDELCEQAVEAWAQVWRSVGAEAGQLRISRMWSGQPRPLPTIERHVVVATIQTLNARLTNRSADYEFLRDFKLAVFDEAHRSIAPTFTSVMQEIGLTYRRSAAEPFLLGLTATPYRGHDGAETARLVRRYGSNRLDSGAFADDDPQAVIGELQDMGVLAQADHETIDGGTFELRKEELEIMARFARGSDTRFLRAWLPQSAEDRIAQNADRTRRIIEAYEEHIQPGWPTLIFATSVEHAQTLAALLNRNGTTARAVSGETDPATRRRVVESFRNGEIEALVNYAVFGEGFDAPKTRAIFVARPVYSPNLYFQMIGRGLRGPMNGGDERCLILNVRDNIANFRRALAFSDLDWLWAT